MEMPKAIWHDQVLAESSDTIVVEGNHYFPPDSINSQFFSASSKETNCLWKGTANYYTLEVKGSVNQDAAWVYRNPKAAASEIKDYVAFWHGVQVVDG
jgi:uncharacterized protein (DUF427 family)